MVLRLWGWVLLVGSGIVILNSVINADHFAEDVAQYGYWYAVTNNGAPGYTFLPPYTSFEIITMIAAATGLALIIVDSQKRKRGASRSGNRFGTVVE